MMYVILRHTLVRALRTVRLVAGHIKDSALDGDVSRVVWVGAYFIHIKLRRVELYEPECNSPSHFDR